MKAFLNPLLLLVCILLLACACATSATGEEGAGVVETWALTLCLLGVIINGTLGTARAMTGLPAVAPIGWAVGYLVFGSIVWALVSSENQAGVSSQERALLHERVTAWKCGQLSPYTEDENGDGVLSLAAGLGAEEVVAEVLEDAAEAASHGYALVRATHRAAERNREAVLRLLIPSYVAVDSRLGGAEGPTPLHAAALSSARRSAACLLELGANVNAVAADGATPLHHAVLADDEAMVRLLLQHGADPTIPDADGRAAASYARTEGIMNALELPPPPAENPAGL